MKTFKITFLLFIFVMTGFSLNYKRYENIGHLGDPNFFDLIKWKFTREKPVWPKLPENKPGRSNTDIPKKVFDDDLVVTYVNHSTMLIQTGGENILTDPIGSSHAGPFGEFGVKRSIYPGVEIDDLPEIDFILISHSHYDHLDLPTIDALTAKYKPVIITGLGVSRYIDYCQEKAGNCYELEWWENVKVFDSEVAFHFVPAYHWSSRYFIDKDTSLWGGFVISNHSSNVYFAGDTGFSDGKIFQSIKDRYGDFRLALLPIGAYKPSWFFSSMHTSPLEAVKISKILDSNYTIPIHYDTFELTDDKYEDPLNDLKLAIEEEKVNEDKFLILEAGATWHVPGK